MNTQFALEVIAAGLQLRAKKIWMNDHAVKERYIDFVCVKKL